MVEAPLDAEFSSYGSGTQTLFAVDSGLTSWESAGVSALQGLFERQISCAKQKARHVEQEIERLRQDRCKTDDAKDKEHATAGPSQDAIVPSQVTAAKHGLDKIKICEEDFLDATTAKLAYLSAQIQVYKTMMTIIVAQDGKLKLDDVTDDNKQQAFWQEACRLINAMATGMEESTRLPNEAFVGIWRDFVIELSYLCDEYPEAGGCVLFAGGTVGAVATTVWTVTHVHTTLMSMLLTVVKFPFLLAGGFATGGIAGIIAAAALLGVRSSWRYYTGSGAEDLPGLVTHRLKLEELMRNLKGSELTPEALIECREQFDKVFNQPALSPKESDTCIVCFEHFPLIPQASHCTRKDAESDCNPKRAVRAPLCDGRHFLHYSCHVAWARESGDLRCTVCRR